MSETARRPSAEELEELVEICRRDPGSPAFIELGDMYMALGRPRDAVEVGVRGLQAGADTVDGRMMLSRALAMLHQWKQAQVELLKVVKADRNHAAGFALLGEVLMRRGDYERALPVLQHAQNLDPANPGMLGLLRRARAGQPLDPPPPVPSAVPPRPGAAGPRASARMAAALPAMDPPDDGPGFAEDAPTRVNDPPPPPGRGDPTIPVTSMGSPDAVPIRDRLPLQSGPVPTPPVPRTQIGGLGDADPYAAAPASGVGAGAFTDQGVPPTLATASLSGGSMHGAHAEAGAGAPGEVRPRPRVLPAAKPRDAARDGLRQSAAIGENYLNYLLTNGLLDIPSVRAPESEVDLAPGKRWGRSTRRAFILLFVLLFLGVGGGGGWFWWTEKQRALAVAEHLGTAEELMATTTHDDLQAAVAASVKAIERDNQSWKAIVLRGQAGGLGWLLYGVEDEQAETAITRAGNERSIKPGHPLWRSVLIGRAAIVLATLSRRDAPVDLLGDLRRELDAHLADAPDDGLVLWLSGVAALATGDRTAARAAFEKADADRQGPAVAAIWLADMLADEGDHERALALYDSALERAAKHPLALVGRALARAETGGDPDAITADLNVGLASDSGPRVAAYKALAQAFASHSLESYADFGEQLDKATGVLEPRFVGRVALGRLLQGDLQGATEARGAMRWYGEGDPKDRHPLAQLVDAELTLALGDPGKALEALGEPESESAAGGVRARLLRARAHYDKGERAKAAEVLGPLVEAVPDMPEPAIWRAGAALAVARGRARTAAIGELDKLSRQLKTKLARYVYGDALLAIGRRGPARDQLDRSLQDITADEPNPMAYRAHVALARLDYAEGKLEAASKHLAAALEQNASYLPAHALLGQVKLAAGDPAGALESLGVVLGEPDLVDAGVLLAYAQALVTRPDGASDDDRAAARDALRAAKERGAKPEQLAPVVEQVDPALAEELGVTLPKKK